MPQSSPIHSLFLTEFDMIKGYSTLYSNSISSKSTKTHNQNYTIEFKSLPSGIHNFDDQFVFFTILKDDVDSNDKVIDLRNDVLYGISYYKRYLKSPDTTDRKNIKMYSLTILIDPVHYNTFSVDLNSNWSFKIYNQLWNFSTLLNNLFHHLIQFDTDFKLDLNKALLDSFFNNYKFKPRVNTQLFSSSSLSSNTVVDEQSSESTTPPSTAVLSSTPTELPSDLKTAGNPNNHLIYYLFELINEDLGPLIFKLFKLSLLRKNILLYSHDNTINNTKFLKIIYCLSLISSIPLNLQNYFIDSRLISAEKVDDLKATNPIFNIILNDLPYLSKLDLDNLKKREKGYLASTTDLILLEKNLDYFDYSLNISTKSLPSLKDLKTTKLQFSTQRDLKKFNYIKNVYLSASEEDEQECQNDDDTEEENEHHGDADHEERNFSRIIEPMSIKEYIWNGFNWWASAGGSISLDDDNVMESNEVSKIPSVASSPVIDSLPPSPSPMNPTNQLQHNSTLLNNPTSEEKIKQVLELLGYFHNFTTKIFSMLVELINNDESSSSKRQHNDGYTDEDDNACDEDGEEGEGETLINHSDEEHNASSETTTNGKERKVVYIESRDIQEMGLDPYSAQDLDFLQQLTALYFDRELRLGSYFNLCCM